MTTVNQRRGSFASIGEPWWPYPVATIAVFALHYALPASLRIWPPWLGAGIGVILASFGLWTAFTGRRWLNQQCGYLLALGLTIAVLYGVVRLVIAVLTKSQPPMVLLRSAVILWPSNIIAFAVWFFRLDAGGPIARKRTDGYASNSFLFPQMTLPGEKHQRWQPHFIDYLFLSFNTSTAFSPTDVPVLSRWAKLLSMLESIISLSILIILVARAVNGL